jgi:hypothetical protein
LVEHDDGDDGDNDHEFVSALSGVHYHVSAEQAALFSGSDGRAHQEAFLAAHAQTEVSNTITQVITSDALSAAMSGTSETVIDEHKQNEIKKIVADGVRSGKTIEDIEVSLQHIVEMKLDDASTFAARAELLNREISESKTLKERESINDKITALKTEIDTYSKRENAKDVSNLKASLDLLSAHLDDRMTADHLSADTNAETTRVHWTVRFKQAFNDVREWLFGKKGESTGREPSQLSESENALAKVVNADPARFVRGMELEADKGNRSAKTVEEKKAALSAAKESLQMAQDAKAYVEQRASGKKWSFTQNELQKTLAPDVYLEAMNGKPNADETPKTEEEQEKDLANVEAQLKRLGKAWVERGISDEAITTYNARAEKRGVADLLSRNTNGDLVIEGRGKTELSPNDYNRIGRIFMEEVGGAKAEGNKLTSTIADLRDVKNQQLWLQVTVDAEHAKTVEKNPDADLTTLDDMYSNLTEILKNPFMYHAFEGNYLDVKQDKKPISKKDAAKALDQVSVAVDALKRVVDFYGKELGKTPDPKAPATATAPADYSSLSARIEGITDASAIADVEEQDAIDNSGLSEKQKQALTTQLNEKVMSNRVDLLDTDFDKLTLTELQQRMAGIEASAGRRGVTLTSDSEVAKKYQALKDKVNIKVQDELTAILDHVNGSGYISVAPDELADAEDDLEALQEADDGGVGNYLEIIPDEAKLAGAEMLSAEQKATALALGADPTAQGITSAQRDAAAEPLKLVQKKVSTLMDDVQQMKDSGVDVSKIEKAYKEFRSQNMQFVREPIADNYDVLESKFNDLFAAAQHVKDSAVAAGKQTETGPLTIDQTYDELAKVQRPNWTSNEDRLEYVKKKIALLDRCSDTSVVTEADKAKLKEALLHVQNIYNGLPDDHTARSTEFDRAFNALDTAQTTVVRKVFLTSITG